MQQRSLEHFNLLYLLSCNFNKYNNFVTLTSTRLRLTEDDADASKHVAVFTIYKILLIHICCTFVGLDNKTDIRIACLYM
jgi:hypothetical protein